VIDPVLRDEEGTVRLSLCLAKPVSRHWQGQASKFVVVGLNVGNNDVSVCVVMHLVVTR
jgi:hypothetical protein